MNARERVLTAIDHKEPDRIPFDLGGMAQSGIHRIGYAKLREYLGLPEEAVNVLNINTQQAKFGEDIQDRLLIDSTIVYSDWANPEKAIIEARGDYLVYTDEWGILRHSPKNGGLYFDVASHPLATDDVVEKFRRYPWPKPIEPDRVKEMHEEARRAHDRGQFVVLMGLCPGIVEMYAWLRGFERFYIDLVSEPQISEMFLDKMVELKSAYWEMTLTQMGDCVDAVNEADDMAGQKNLLISPVTYRKVIKPHHRRLFGNIKKTAPAVKTILHSCGAVRKLIPDFIECGVDILNPVQISASGMEAVELKREFGKDICFWGGGVDAQNTLSTASLKEIRTSVQINIDALAPGGGFVFAPTHIIQPNVPPENIMAMWNALQEYGSYHKTS